MNQRSYAMPFAIAVILAIVGAGCRENRPPVPGVAGKQDDGKKGDSKQGDGKKTAAALAEEVLDGVRKGDYPGWMQLLGREDVVPLLEKSIDDLSPRGRRDLLRYVRVPGYPVNRRQDRWLHSFAVVKVLVGRVAADPDQEVRNEAAEILVESVPDVYVRAYCKEIVVAARKWPFYHSIRLLGKTGCAEAMELLRSDPSWMFQNDLATEAALAKLGDTSLSAKIVDAFRKERDAFRKAQLAQRLGYIGDAASAVALAREIRSGVIYDRGGFRRALRADIVQALSRIYPNSEVFWLRPMERPTGDAWYEGVEKWLKDYLGMEWSEARPPFFYEGNLHLPGAK